MLALVFVCLADPISLDAMSAVEASRLNGKVVTITFTVGKPLVTWKGNTLASPADRPDQIERTVILKGERLDVRHGQTVAVTGTMRLIHHPAARVGTVFVPQWEEVRVEEDGVRLR